MKWMNIYNIALGCMCVWVYAQLCPTLCSPIDCSLPACQASLSKAFPWQEYWNVLPFPPPWDLPNSGIKPMSPIHLLHCRWILYHWATREVNIHNTTLCVYAYAQVKGQEWNYDPKDKLTDQSINRKVTKTFSVFISN